MIRRGHEVEIYEAGPVAGGMIYFSIPAYRMPRDELYREIKRVENKVGSQTTSHLCFGPEPIHAPYLISSANFITCHKCNFIKFLEMLQHAADRVWDELPHALQKITIDRNIDF